MCTATAPRASRRPELADIFRAHGHRLDGLTADQHRVVRAITACRTAALGGHVRTCDRCGYQEISYNSCRDRHCPKCPALDEARWVEARKAALLPVEYFHVVFTVPEELQPLLLGNQAVGYGLLFAAVSETLLEVARNPRNLGAQIGFTAVLHTWTQRLLYHPHIHCIVPGGGLSPDGDRWIPAKPGFFLPVRILSEVFRGKLLDKMRQAFLRGRMVPPHRHDHRKLLGQAAVKPWVVYSKPPFAGAQQVISYLGRYAHRIAISNDRLVSIQNDQVTFRWKDRANQDRPRLETLEATSFLRRFLLHVVPRRFVRLRHYGLLANAHREKQLAKCRDLLDAAPPPEATREPETWQALLLRLTGKDVLRCPRCGSGQLEETAIPRAQAPAWRLPGAGATA